MFFVLYLAKISGERLQDHWSSGLGILSQSLETHLSYHYNIKKVVLAPKTSSKCLTVIRKLMQKFVYQLF